MKKQQIPLKNSLILLLTATIWGIAFVAQSEGGEAVGPLTFNATRNIIGSLVLIPVILLLNKINPQSNSADFTESDRQPMASSGSNPFSRNKTLIAGGIICGICLCLASNFQQFGIQYTSVGKAGFLTACYIIIVPILGLFMKKKCSPFIWVAVVMALIGLYLLCITDGFSVGKGDLLVMVCSLLFSLHILVIDYFSPKVDGVKMSCIQFFVCGLVSGAGMLLLEHPAVSDILMAWQSILYAGLLDSLCRCDVLRCCVHPADHRTERYEPDCGFSDLKSGILHLGTGRLDPSESEAFRTGVIRMCADVCSDHSGTASLREKGIICLSHRMLFSVKSEKLPVFFMNMTLKKTGNNSVGGHVFCQNPETYKSKCHHRR